MSRILFNVIMEAVKSYQALHVRLLFSLCVLVLCNIETVLNYLNNYCGSFFFVCFSFVQYWVPCVYHLLILLCGSSPSQQALPF